MHCVCMCPIKKKSPIKHVKKIRARNHFPFLNFARKKVTFCNKKYTIATYTYTLYSRDKKKIHSKSSRFTNSHTKGILFYMYCVCACI